ncbi:MAG: 4-formylbenzenesulfonate dehydrogenase TsaC1/TsaC2 [Candidatus Heimdallarchaeota archaeon LC_3]|nr:MAG: 4-formylbenzenesulfonate dehydrogenase TsaC1/TsaC2 [Candidatus Heimdallarchaeota archaeon LC_3]
MLITGASGVFSDSVIRLLSKKDYNLILTDINTDKCNKLVKELLIDEKSYLIDSCDVTDEESIDQMLKSTKTKFESIDILIHIAGTYRGGNPAHETALNTWDFLFNLNAKSFLLLAKKIVPSMIKKKYGVIITISSKSAMEKSPNSGVYAASKSATFKLTESLANELLDKGIRVNTILPSIIDTKQNREMMSGSDFSKWVHLDSVANVINFLISDNAKDISGAGIPVYGRVS